MLLSSVVNKYQTHKAKANTYPAGQVQVQGQAPDSQAQVQAFVLKTINDLLIRKLGIIDIVITNKQ